MAHYELETLSNGEIENIVHANLYYHNHKYGGGHLAKNLALNLWPSPEDNKPITTSEIEFNYKMNFFRGYYIDTAGSSTDRATIQEGCGSIYGYFDETRFKEQAALGHRFFFIKTISELSDGNTVTNYILARGKAHDSLTNILCGSQSIYNSTQGSTCIGFVASNLIYYNNRQSIWNSDGSLYQAQAQNKTYIGGSGNNLTALNNYSNSGNYAQLKYSYIGEENAAWLAEKTNITNGIMRVSAGIYKSFYGTGTTVQENVQSETTAPGIETILWQLEEIPDFIPVFDIEDKNAILAYVERGDDSGRIDPFSPVEPKLKEVKDFKTDFTCYISIADNKRDTHFSIVARNTDYGSNLEDLQGLYAEYILVSNKYENQDMRTSLAQIPTVSYSDYMPDADNYSISCRFGVYPENPYTTEDNSSGYFRIKLLYDKTSAVKCKVYEVDWGNPEYTDIQTCTRKVITNGYRYTAPSGETMTILFRSITLDDIKDIYDEGYPARQDEQNNTTGETPDLILGQGLRTYKIGNGGFKAVNDALWTTNWTEVFKSSSVDPIKCVIACKGIPFDVDGMAADAIYIANRTVDTFCVYVNPIKKISIGDALIQPIYGNFVDIYYTKIHLYLPYIGWYDLPASEVMGRYGKPEFNIQGVAHRLHFDYLVDFVDGQCRCIISVDGTERYYFDGNCAIDIPVTSDNHTAAISGAIKAGVQTTMSIAAIAGGAVSGNAGAIGGGLVGAINSAPNIVPTYEFSATASSSGYINASMNKQIMIIIEYPNAFYPNGYGHKMGYPCQRNLSLASLHGFTKCINVDVSGINATAAELDLIKSNLENGVYL